MLLWWPVFGRLDAKHSPDVKECERVSELCIIVVDGYTILEYPPPPPGGKSVTSERQQPDEWGGRLDRPLNKPRTPRKDPSRTTPFKQTQNTTKGPVTNNALQTNPEHHERTVTDKTPFKKNNNPKKTTQNTTQTNPEHHERTRHGGRPSNRPRTPRKAPSRTTPFKQTQNTTKGPVTNKGRPSALTRRKQEVQAVSVPWASAAGPAPPAGWDPGADHLHGLLVAPGLRAAESGALEGVVQVGAARPPPRAPEEALPPLELDGRGGGGGVRVDEEEGGEEEEGGAHCGGGGAGAWTRHRGHGGLQNKQKIYIYTIQYNFIVSVYIWNKNNC